MVQNGKNGRMRKKSKMVKKWYFFEKKVAEYRIAGVGTTEEEMKFSLDDSF